ncbi:flavin reductase family protein [Vibrio sp. WXL103]|uniref:flavin reductase family protein n=1 Tax=unclassified Vibrio TaxID=2614977 RepID=UPI003EC938A2
MHITNQELAALDTRYRANLVNSLSGFKSANLIGSVSPEGNTNLAIVSSVFHLGAHPPLIGMISRPHSVARDTLENILSIGEYTINHVNRDIFEKAHQTSARYPSDVSEFEAVGLTPQWREGVRAPFVEESRLKYSLQLRSSQTIELNDVILLIGEVTHLYLQEEAISPQGYVDIESLDTIAVSGLDTYHITDRIGRLTYAKPDTLPKHLD